MKADTINLVPQSGGKDSQASLLYALNSGAQNIRGVFADTGIEHEKTYEHLDYLRGELGVHIQTVRANFDQQLAQKRLYIDFIWRAEGVENTVCDEAIKILKPTGIPFLDLCLWKGRFPGHATAAFCTFELKQKPMEEFQDYLFRNCCKNLIVWQGTRREESFKRRSLTPWEPIIGDIYERKGLIVHRPIVYWTKQDVIEYSARCGVRLNPLYTDGFNRVGCMPCKNEVKESIRLISEKYPEYIDIVREFERLVSSANKFGVSTFFDGRIAAKYLDDDNFEIDTHGIDTVVKWANSSRRGRFWQSEMFPQQNECSLAGYCE